MKKIKTITKTSLIAGLLITGIGSCALATTMSGNAGFDAIMPALFGWICTTAAIIYLVIDFATKGIIRLREVRKTEGRSSPIVNSNISQLNELLILSSLTFLTHCFTKYSIFGLTANFGIITTLVVLVGFITSYFGLKQQKRLFKVLWLVLLAVLFLNSIFILSLSLLSFTLWSILLLTISTAYVYCIKKLLKVNETEIDS